MTVEPFLAYVIYAKRRIIVYVELRLNVHDRVYPRIVLTEFISG